MLLPNSWKVIWLASIYVLASAASALEDQSWRLKVEEFGDAISRFGSILMGAMDPRENVVFSPIAVHQVLLLVLQGARSGSRTERDLRVLLGCGLFQSGLTIRECNEQYARVTDEFQWLKEKAKAPNKTQRRLRWGRDVLPLIDVLSMFITKGDGLHYDFHDTTSEFYNHSVVNLVNESVESQVLDRVNKWGAEAGFVEKPLMSLDGLGSSWRLMLVTATRFEASWFSQFEETRRDHVFYNRGRKDQSVGGTLLRHANAANVRAYIIGSHSDELRSKVVAQMVEIPLQGAARLIIIHPVVWQKGDELDRIIDDLTFPSSDGTTELDTLLANFDRYTYPNAAQIELPKFKFENEIDLLDGIDLERAGLAHTFSKANGDISRILMNGLPIAVDKATHHAVIEVEKDGINAAVAARISPPPIEPPLMRYTFEHPFMFLIRFNEMTLFAGKLLELK